MMMMKTRTRWWGSIGRHLRLSVVGTDKTMTGSDYLKVERTWTAEVKLDLDVE